MALDFPHQDCRRTPTHNRTSVGVGPASRHPSPGPTPLSPRKPATGSFRNQATYPDHPMKMTIWQSRRGLSRAPPLFQAFGRAGRDWPASSRKNDVGQGHGAGRSVLAPKIAESTVTQRGAPRPSRRQPTGLVVRSAGQPNSRFLSCPRPKAAGPRIDPASRLLAWLRRCGLGGKTLIFKPGRQTKPRRVRKTWWFRRRAFAGFLHLHMDFGAETNQCVSRLRHNKRRALDSAAPRKPPSRKTLERLAPR